MLRKTLKLFRKELSFPKFSTSRAFIEAEWNKSIPSSLKRNNYLLRDHTPIYAEEEEKMLEKVGVKTLDDLMEQVIPKMVRDRETIDKNSIGKVDPAVPVDLLHMEFKEIMSKNKLNKTYIGAGFYGTLVPHCIERNFLSNPGWYTAYTPYQAEISQGRLHGLMVFQELCRKLAGFEIAGASLLDEASAAAEAMLLAWGSSKGKAQKYYVDEGVFPSSIRVMKTNADQLGIEVIVTDINKLSDSDLQGACGIHMQSPDNLGKLRDWTDRISSAKEANKNLIASVGSDLAALMLFKNPGDMGADIAYGNT